MFPHTISPLKSDIVAPRSYRFRLVSISCDPNYTFSIDGHNLTVIEVDGINSQPLLVDSIQIFAAQRYSFVVCPAHFMRRKWTHPYTFVS